MADIQPVFTLNAVVQRIFELRGGQRVMLDSDLAVLYGVETKNLIKATKRNPERFPKNFIFQLSEAEWMGRISYPVKNRFLANNIL